jgi:hypothetical protein
MLAADRVLDGLRDGAEADDADTERRGRLRPGLSDRRHPGGNTQDAGTFALRNPEVKR